MSKRIIEKYRAVQHLTSDIKSPKVGGAHLDLFEECLRFLGRVYGTGRFIGTPVVLAETKTDTRRREVIEICLPDQWCIYQMHIAQLKRIYYLDVPVSYAQLNEVFPPLCVKPFGHFFEEADTLISSPS